MRNLATLFVFSFTAVATTFTVNSTADVVDAVPGNGVCETAGGTPVCTLRAAIQEAGALSGSHTIIVPAGTYRLSATPACSYFLVSDPNGITENMSALCLKGNVTIAGAGADVTIIDAGGQNGATCCGSYPSAAGMAISRDANVSISGLTVTHGRGFGGLTIRGGGGIANHGTLHLTNVTLPETSRWVAPA